MSCSEFPLWKVDAMKRAVLVRGDAPSSDPTLTLARVSTANHEEDPPSSGVERRVCFLDSVTCAFYDPGVEVRSLREDTTYVPLDLGAMVPRLLRGSMVDPTRSLFPQHHGIARAPSSTGTI